VFSTEDSPDWLYTIGHPFGGLRVLRQEPNDNSFTVQDAKALHADKLRSGGLEDFVDDSQVLEGTSGFVCTRRDGVRGGSANTTSRPLDSTSSSLCSGRSPTSGVGAVLHSLVA
jgi:hypothetical protein